MGLLKFVALLLNGKDGKKPVLWVILELRLSVVSSAIIR